MGKTEDTTAAASAAPVLPLKRDKRKTFKEDIIEESRKDVKMAGFIFVVMSCALAMGIGSYSEKFNQATRTSLDDVRRDINRLTSAVSQQRIDIDSLKTSAREDRESIGALFRFINSNDPDMFQAADANSARVLQDVIDTTREAHPVKHKGLGQLAGQTADQMKVTSDSDAKQMAPGSLERTMKEYLDLENTAALKRDVLKLLKEEIKYTPILATRTETTPYNEMIEKLRESNKAMMRAAYPGVATLPLSVQKATADTMTELVKLDKELSNMNSEADKAVQEAKQRADFHAQQAKIMRNILQLDDQIKALKGPVSGKPIVPSLTDKQRNDLIEAVRGEETKAQIAFDDEVQKTLAFERTKETQAHRKMQKSETERIGKFDAFAKPTKPAYSPVYANVLGAKIDINERFAKPGESPYPMGKSLVQTINALWTDFEFEIEGGTALGVNEAMIATTGAMNGGFAIMQSDCNFVVYRMNDRLEPKPVWDSKTWSNTELREKCEFTVEVLDGVRFVGSVAWNHNKLRKSKIVFDVQMTGQSRSVYDLAMKSVLQLTNDGFEAEMRFGGGGVVRHRLLTF